MDELLAITALAHYPWYSQLRLANYYSRVLNVSVRIHIENYIASEDIRFINLSIAIVYQNFVNVFRKYTCRRSRPVRSSLVRATFLIVSIQYRHNVLYRPALRQSDGHG